jgi:hypothetical protein
MDLAVATAEGNYRSVLGRMAAVSGGESAPPPSTVKVIDRAFLAPPGLIETLTPYAAALAGLLLGLGLAYAFIYFDPTARTAEDAGALLDLPVLASIPRSGRRRRAPSAVPQGGTP